MHDQCLCFFSYVLWFNLSMHVRFRGQLMFFLFKHYFLVVSECVIGCYGVSQGDEQRSERRALIRSDCVWLGSTACRGWKTACRGSEWVDLRRLGWAFDWVIDLRQQLLDGGLSGGDSYRPMIINPDTVWLVLLFKCWEGALCTVASSHHSPNIWQQCCWRETTKRNKNSVIIYSPSWHFKPVRLIFCAEHKRIYFEELSFKYIYIFFCLLQKKELFIFGWTFFFMYH